jgi:hypothetical protein
LSKIATKTVGDKPNGLIPLKAVLRAALSFRPKATLLDAQPCFTENRSPSRVARIKADLSDSIGLGTCNRSAMAIPLPGVERHRKKHKEYCQAHNGTDSD